METTTTNNDGSTRSNAHETLPKAQPSSNVVELLPQEIEMETRCEGGVCMLAWKPKRPPRTAA